MRIPDTVSGSGGNGSRRAASLVLLVPNVLQVLHEARQIIDRARSAHTARDLRSYLDT